MANVTVTPWRQSSPRRGREARLDVTYDDVTLEVSSIQLQATGYGSHEISLVVRDPSGAEWVRDKQRGASVTVPPGQVRSMDLRMVPNSRGDLTRGFVVDPRVQTPSSLRAGTGVHDMHLSMKGC